MTKTITTITTETFDINGKLVTRKVETKQDALKPLRAHILIDNSSSMNGSESKVETGVNEYVATLKKKAEESGLTIRVSVSMFSSPAMSWNTRSTISQGIIRPLRAAVSVGSFAPLHRNEIVPEGYTPLYDAIGDTVRELEVGEANEDVVLVILTDGQENTSTVHNAQSIKSLLEAKQKNNWAIIYLGANQDAWAVGGSVGIAAGMTSGYTMDNMVMAFNSASAATERYATTRSTKTAAFTAQEVGAMGGKK